MQKLKSELKNEEMALVLLKKLQQSQQLSREITNLGGGATLTATKVTGKNDPKFDPKFDPKNLSRQNSTNDMLNSEKLVSGLIQHDQLVFPHYYALSMFPCLILRGTYHEELNFLLNT